MSCVIDLSRWRRASRFLSHPAGVTLPLEVPGHASLLIPEVREAISNGTHCADVARLLATAVRAGERVLVVGSGIGVVSTLVAKTRGVERVIAIEPNIALAAYIDHVHSANEVPWIEILNGVPVGKKRGRIPVFVRQDVRTSSLSPDDGTWKQVMLVPGVNLDLILAEERISLIVAESSAISAQLLAHAELGAADRILFASRHVTEGSCDQDELVARLAARGFGGKRFGAVLRFDRAGAGAERHQAHANRSRFG